MEKQIESTNIVAWTFFFTLWTFLVFSIGDAVFLLPNLFGMQVIFPIVLLVMVLPVCLLRVDFAFKEFRNPLFITPLLLLLLGVILRNNFSGDLLCAVIFVRFLLMVGRRGRELAMHCMIVFVFVLSIMALLQGVILILDSDLQSAIMFDYTQYEQNTEIVIEHPLILLGMGTEVPTRFLGFDLIRLRSFEKEPSLLLGRFLLLGCLALTYNNKLKRWMGLTIMTFCVVSFSGSVHVAIFFSMLALICLQLSRMFKKNLWFLPVVIIIMFMLLLQFGDIGYVTSFFVIDAGIDKSVGGFVRFSVIKETFNAAYLAPFGIASEAILPVGWLIRVLTQGGFVAGILFIIIQTKIFQMIGTIFLNDWVDRFQKIAVIALMGSYLAIVTFNEYGLVGAFGYTMLTLTYCRLQDIIDDAKLCQEN